MATKTKSASPPQVEYATAMDKIRDEMAKSKDNYVQVVGEYLTDYLLAHPEAEAALLDKGKSISGSLAAVRKEAEKVKTGNMAILDDRTVFGIVLGYFGIKAEADVVNGRTTSSVSADALPPSPEGEGKGNGDAIQKPSPLGEGGSPRSGETKEVVPVAHDPFDLDALLASGLAGLSPSDPQESPGETRDAKRGGALTGVM